MGRFAGRRILVTGGSSGIGLAGAARIAREGGRVAVTGVTPARLDAARAALPDDALVIANDAGDAGCGTALAAAIAPFGPIDGLWLNAGYAAVAAPEAVDAAHFDRMMAANVRGPILQLAALSPLLADGGAVVLTASSSVYEGAAAASVYSATKGAIVALGRCWASALAPRRIRVNTLIPGAVATGFRDFMRADDREAFETGLVAQVPLARVGTPDEAAAVALFLLSDEASYVTGSQYAVDGGLIRH